MNFYSTPCQLSLSQLDYIVCFSFSWSYKLFSNR